MNRTLSLAALIAASTMMSGCYQYVARYDFIEPWTGNAVVQNRALQMRDPWPRYVYDTNIYTNGQRQADAYNNYATAHEKAPAEDLQAVQLVVPSGQ
ncbi:MAG: hypothetical protein AAF362_15435 [Pseudomonadota bacterium]